MIGKNKIKQITDLVLKMSKADEAEVLIVAGEQALTRFANNMIHQNMTSEDVSVSVRSVFGPPSHKASEGQGKKVGVANSNIQIKDQKSKIDKNLLKQLITLIKKSEEVAKNSGEDEDFAGLPSVQIQNSPPKADPPRAEKLKSVFEKTVEFTAEKRAKVVGKIIEQASKAHLTAFGSLTNGVTEYGIANSKGIFEYHPVSSASLNIRVFSPEGRSGYAGFISTNISDIDFDSLTKQAIHKATFGEKTIEIEPGEYEVILEEPAVAEMMQFLAYLGFGAKNFHEGSSFLTGRLGERVLGENVTIHDNPFHPLTIPMPFDFEGMSKNKLSLIDKGIAKNIVYDYQYGKKYGKNLTGHGLPAPNTEGPLPLHLTMNPGSTKRAELIKKVKKGILVTRFWYVNPIHPKLLNITGMTRDGTFYIENGEIKGAIRNLRFTQSIPEALNNVLDIASEVKAEEGWGGATIVPALRIGKWNFTGSSKL